MKFYDRKQEIAEMQMLDDRAADAAQFTVLMGRCRTGNTKKVSHFQFFF